MKSKKAIKYIYEANPFYVHWKKHFCPKCGNKVELRYVSKIVNSKSPEAKDYDFSVGDTFFVGDVEFRMECYTISAVDKAPKIWYNKEQETRKEGKEDGTL